MSAGTWAYVACDHLDRSKPPGQRKCHERIEEGTTTTEVRRIARQRGWLVRVYPDGRRPRPGMRGLFDFCPDHKPAPKEG